MHDGTGVVYEFKFLTPYSILVDVPIALSFRNLQIEYTQLYLRSNLALN